MTPEDKLRFYLEHAKTVAWEMEEARDGVKTWLQMAQDAAWDQPRLQRNGFVDITRMQGVLDAMSGPKVAHDLHHLILRLYPEAGQEGAE